MGTLCDVIPLPGCSLVLGTSPEPWPGPQGHRGPWGRGHHPISSHPVVSRPILSHPTSSIAPSILLESKSPFFSLALNFSAILQLPRLRGAEGVNHRLSPLALGKKSTAIGGTGRKGRGGCHHPVQSHPGLPHPAPGQPQLPSLPPAASAGLVQEGGRKSQI